MRELPRKLSLERLAELFGTSTPFLERLAQLDDPLGRSRALAAALPEREQIELLDAHPAIGAGGLSGRPAAEQGSEHVPELAALNAAYERRFGFRFVVFVAGRPRSEIVPLLRERLERPRAEELAAGIEAVCSIAEERWRRS